MGGDVDGQRQEILRTQDDLVERTGVELGGRGWVVCLVKNRLPQTMEDKVSNEKSLRTVTMTLQETHLNVLGTETKKHH